MGRKHVHAAVTAGLAVALATGGVPTAAVAESLGIEPAPANESTAAPQGAEASGSPDGASPAAAEGTSEGAEGGDAPDRPDQSAAAPTGTMPAAVSADAVPGIPTGEDVPADPNSGGTEQPQANDFEIVSNTYMTRWVDPGETVDVALPRELQVRYQDNSTEMVSVTWTHQTWDMDIPVIEIVDGVAKSVPAGYHHFEADVKGRTVDFGLDVTERSAGDTQESISSIRPIVVTAYTTEYADPSNELSLGGVEATMANGEQQWLEVAWDAIPRELYDGDEDAGEFTVHGVIERYGNYPVEAKVVVAVPRAGVDGERGRAGRPGSRDARKRSDRILEWFEYERSRLMGDARPRCLRPCGRGVREGFDPAIQAVGADQGQGRRGRRDHLDVRASCACRQPAGL